MAYNVLIVDDSATMRALIRKVLVISGFDIGEYFEGANGQEALGILEHNWVDIILSDIHMPGMDGAALVETLKDHKLWRNIPVVLITTESRPEVINPFLNLGVQDYIQKPFRPETIRKKLTGILGEAQTPDAIESEGCDF
ncbi:MAG: response regulator [Syntrophales bacterium]|nr:response regulator [Syntrophales bacterium]MDD5642074.1 response regulator [Syntrophales bacterium]